MVVFLSIDSTVAIMFKKVVFILIFIQGSLSAQGQPVEISGSDFKKKADPTLLDPGTSDPVFRTFKARQNNRTVRSRSYSTRDLDIDNNPEGRPVVQTAHDSYVLSMQYNRDGSRLYTAAGTGCFDVETHIKVWDDDGNLLQNIAGHTQEVTELVMTPDYRHIVSASKDGTVKVWNPEGRMVRSITVGEKYPLSVDVSPDSRLIATGNEDNSVHLYELSTGKRLHRLAGHSHYAYDVSFHPDGDKLASAGYDGTVRIWSTAGRKLKKIAVNGKKPLYSVKFSPDGRYLAVGGKEMRAKLYTASGSFVSNLGENEDVVSLFFMDEDKLAAGSTYGIKIYNLNNYKLERGLWGGGNAITLHPRRKILAHGGYKTMSFTDINTYKTETLKHPFREFSRISYAYEAEKLAVSTQPPILFDIKSNNIQGLKKPFGEAYIYAFAVNKTADLIAAGTSDKPLVLYNATSGKTKELSSHKKAASYISFSPDNRYMVTGGSDDKMVYLWKTDGRRLARKKMNTYSISGVDFSPDSSKIIYSGYDEDRKIKVLDRNLNIQKEYKMWHYLNYDAKFSSDGNTVIAAGFPYSEVITFNYSSGKKNSLSGHSDYPVDIGVSRQGHFASVSPDKTIRIWSKEKKHLKTLSADALRGYGAEFTADGKFLFSSFTDRSVKVFNIETGEYASIYFPPGGYIVTQGRKFDAHRDALKYVRFTENGRSVPASFNSPAYEKNLLKNFMGSDPGPVTPDVVEEDPLCYQFLKDKKRIKWKSQDGRSSGVVIVTFVDESSMRGIWLSEKPKRWASRFKAELDGTRFSLSGGSRRNLNWVGSCNSSEIYGTDYKIY